jgi:hypothetical protein
MLIMCHEKGVRDASFVQFVGQVLKVTNKCPTHLAYLEEGTSYNIQCV